MLNFFKRSSTSSWDKSWFVQLKMEGLLLNKQGSGLEVKYQFVEPFLSQLQDSGLGVMLEESFLLSWDDFFQASAIEGYEDLSEILCLPRETEASPTLVSFGSLTESSFEVAISHWQDASGKEIRPTLEGALLTADNQSQ